MQGKRSGGINIGTSLILVIFVLLALVTFAALSYMSARSDYILSKEAADRTASYYDANRMAEIYLANIEGILSKYSSTIDSEDTYYEGIENLFNDNDNIKVVDDQNNKYLEYCVAVTSGQNLSVRLRVNYPNVNDDRLFYIEKWATTVNTQWLEDVKNDSQQSGVKLLFD